MDYDVVRNKVIEKRWSGKKNGDAYTNVYNQIKHITDHIQDNDSPLQWLPLDYMTEDEMAMFVSNIMDGTGSREILNNIKNKGYKADLHEFIVDTTDEWSVNMLRREFPTLGNENIRELIPQLRFAVRVDWFEHNRRAKELILRINSQSIEIKKALRWEERTALVLGVGIHNPDYLEAYIEFAEVAVSELLIFEIFLNNNIKDKRRLLDFLWLHLNKFTDDDLNAWANKRFDVLKKLREEHGMREDMINLISEYFFNYMKRKSLYEEEDKINQVLIEELHDKAEQFNYFDKITLYDIGLKQQVLLGEKSSSWKQKIYESYKIIKKARQQGNDWIGQLSVSDLRVVYRETFLSKQDYDERQSMRIARAMLKKEKTITSKQWLFYNMKMRRGYFCEWGITEWYEDYVKIMNVIKRQLLLTYKSIDDQVAYKSVDRVVGDFCDLFYHWEEA